MNTTIKFVLSVLIISFGLWRLFLFLTEPPSVPDFVHEKGGSTWSDESENLVTITLESEKTQNDTLELHQNDTYAQEAVKEDQARQKEKLQKSPEGVLGPLKRHIRIEEDSSTISQVTRDAKGSMILAYSFDRDQKGDSPEGFFAFQTGRGSRIKWLVKNEPSSSDQHLVVAQVPARKKVAPFQILLLGGGDYQDIEVSTRFKPVSGKKAQVGGIVLRYQNPNNYYVAQIDALKDNFSLSRFVRGRSIPITSTTLKIAPEKWHTLKIRYKGDEFEGYLDDKLYVKAKDATFERGKVGLWTKKDSVTYFDDLGINILKPEI
jgi:hypothetical protein